MVLLVILTALSGGGTSLGFYLAGEHTAALVALIITIVILLIEVGATDGLDDVFDIFS